MKFKQHDRVTCPEFTGSEVYAVVEYKPNSKDVRLFPENGGLLCVASESNLKLLEV